MAIEGDFEAIKEEDDLNPKFTLAYNMLRKRSEHFFLTMNEDMLEKAVDSDSEDVETAVIHEMVHRANTETETLF